MVNAHSTVLIEAVVANTNMDKEEDKQNDEKRVTEQLQRALSISAQEEDSQDGATGGAGGGGGDGAQARSGAAAAAAAVSAASTTEHGELYLQEIEAVDDYWGPTFRAVYESDSQEKFLKLLEDRIASHDQEIEKMCNHHYQVSISTNLVFKDISKI